MCFRVPDNAPVKRKMLFASSERQLKNGLAGIAVEVQATEVDEVEYRYVLGRCSK